MSTEPFKIHVEQSVLDDLNDRLRRTRWPDEAEGAGWTMGTSLPYMKRFVSHWLEKYDWRRHEAELNSLDHFTTNVQGTQLHFVHAKSKNPNAVPVLLMHGWPHSFYPFHRVVPLLSDNFHVVVPSMPGTGFSDRRAQPMERVAELYASLMTEELGYKRFIAAGGDGGAMISLSMGRQFEDLLLGMHLTDVGYPDHTTDFASLAAPEQEFAGFVQNWWMKEGAFHMIQSTKPQSVAFAFNDSPTGLAAWILSMMSSLSTGEEIEERFGCDELITNIMIYWITETIASSMRIYYAEAERSASEQNRSGKSTVPTGVAHCPYDAPLPREWAERRTNLIHFSDLERGGHFTAWEAPEIWVEDFRKFARKLLA